MAFRLGFHVDTIKRLLDRYGIHTALSSKHITTDDQEPTWTRPCMKCKCTTPRPKNQYICTPCKRDPSFSNPGVKDDMYVY